jgi:hypothetical protein
MKRDRVLTHKKERKSRSNLSLPLVPHSPNKMLLWSQYLSVSQDDKIIKYSLHRPWWWWILHIQMGHGCAIIIQNGLNFSLHLQIFTCYFNYFMWSAFCVRLLNYLYIYPTTFLFFVFFYLFFFYLVISCTYPTSLGLFSCVSIISIH